MAFIKKTKKKDGTIVYWVHDRREGRYLTLAECTSPEAAELYKEQYHMRRSLEKEGYFNRYEKIADDVFGKKKVPDALA